jgi:pSer/pThr/pTyr-binding forkhead associated (FHA) protein
MGDFDDNDTNWDETTTLPLIPNSVTTQKRVLFVLQQITESETILGRGKECGIHIDLPDLSRAHAKLFCLNEECLLKDLKSRNGCFLNGVKVHAATLRGGDTLQVGRIIFTFHEGRP